MVGWMASSSGNASHLSLSPMVEEDPDDESQSLAFGVEGPRPAAAAARKTSHAAQRKGALAAQAMSLSALVLALISICLLSVIAFRLGGGSGAAQPNLRDVIGLAGARAAEADNDGRGWYRTYLRTMVRESESLDSAQVEMLPSGSLVWVAERKGRRAHVLHPMKGWMSIRSTEGLEIMRPDTTYAGKMNETEFVDMLKTPEMKNATKRLRDASAKLSALQAKMKRTIEKVTDKDIYKKVGQKSKEVGNVVQKKAPKLEQLAAQELKKVIDTKGADNFFKGLAKQPGMKEITSGAQADAMAMKDMERLQSHLQGSIDEVSAKAETSADHLASAAVAAGDGALHA